MSGRTESPRARDHRFQVGEWRVEPLCNRVSRGDETLHLELKVMEVLVCLARRAGKVVSRRELVDAVWATEFISDNTLTHAIAEIRGALGDDARRAEYVETIPKRGYRLIAPVAWLTDAVPSLEDCRFKVLYDGRAVLLDEGENLIGRLAEAHVVVDVVGVSRRHARITVQGETANLEDLGSKNGTYLGGRRVDGPVALRDGDEIRLGRHCATLRFLAIEEGTITEQDVDEPSNPEPVHEPIA